MAIKKVELERAFGPPRRTSCSPGSVELERARERALSAKKVELGRALSAGVIAAKDGALGHILHMKKGTFLKEVVMVCS